MMIRYLLFINACMSSANGHGTMISPSPRQPESAYWYQVGCMIGCECSGGGKEDYPTPESLGCADPAAPTLANREEVLTFNAQGMSPRGAWNEYMPWRSPGSAVPIDSCGIASGFLPTAQVQYPQKFASKEIQQGQRGTELPPGPITQWEAGSIVDVSFYLIVNHGGGYQYRVCPKNSSDDNDEMDVMDESCFEQHPLVFADGVHTVVLGDDKRIEIPATDVSSGTLPEGSAWRRIPLPACNCDSGDGSCSPDSFWDYAVSYSAGSAYGRCPTGLQFVPPHISDGLWPEGYGYYVSRLASARGEDDADGQKGKGVCSIHEESNACLDDTQHNCKWYTEWSVCYETRGGDESSGSKSITGFCSVHTDKASCLAGTKNGNACTWYDSPDKTVCYYDKAKKEYSKEDAEKEYKEDNNDGDNNNNSGSKDGEWHITDRVYAPTQPGQYILQWRWDNEQTPQIWTTCADIEVLPEGQQPPKQSPTLRTKVDSNESGISKVCQSLIFVALATLAMACLPNW